MNDNVDIVAAIALACLSSKSFVFRTQMYSFKLSCASPDYTCSVVSVSVSVSIVPSALFALFASNSLLINRPS